MCQYIQQSIREEEHTAHHDFSRVSYHPDTIARQYIETTWVSTFAQPSGEDQHSPFERARWRCERALPQRWQAYTSAWHDIVSLHRQYQQPHNWRFMFLDERQRVFDSSAPRQVFHVIGDPISSIEGISHATKHIVKRENGLTIPLFDHRLLRSQETWKDWWIVLQRVRSRLPDEEDSFHLYTLGRLSNPRAWIKPGRPPDPRWPNNTSRSCILCLQDRDESWDHVFFRCSVGEALWRYMFPPIGHPRNAVELLSIDDLCPMQLAYAAGYVHLLYKLLRSRRLAPLPPLPVDHVRLYEQGCRISRKAVKLQILPED